MTDCWSVLVQDLKIFSSASYIRKRLRVFLSITWTVSVSGLEALTTWTYVGGVSGDPWCSFSASQFVVIESMFRTQRLLALTVQVEGALLSWWGKRTAAMSRWTYWAFSSFLVHLLWWKKQNEAVHCASWECPAEQLNDSSLSLGAVRLELACRQTAGK